MAGRFVARRLGSLGKDFVIPKDMIKDIQAGDGTNFDFMDQ